jgi:ubiquinone/menaquinone biosynthesis C-methylase UbiE
MEQTARRQFLEDYRTIRHAESRGSDDAAYYLALPYRDLSARNARQWRIRAKSYRYFERKILAGIERAAGRSLDILDLGAGNAWMSYRLALRNHRPIALDIFNDPKDGLRAARVYPRRFPVLEAEFDQLPLPQASADIAVYNSSIHYSVNYCRTLAEARRVLRPGGSVVILDSPVYRKREHGEQMVAERHSKFERRYGFRSDSLPSIEYFDEAMLVELSRELNMTWTIHRPWYGWQWHLRPLKARLGGRRPPSRFWILVGRFGRP